MVGPLDAGRADERARASYVTKLGFEIVGVGKASRSTWDLASRAARGDRQAAHEWRAFEAATFGARMIEMDERAALFAQRGKLERETENFWLDDGALARTVVEIDVSRDDLSLLRCAERRKPHYLAAMMHAVQTSRTPRDEWAVWLDDAAMVVSLPVWRARHRWRDDGPRSESQGAVHEGPLSLAWTHADGASAGGHRGASGEACGAAS